MEIALITTPVGLNLYVNNSIKPKYFLKLKGWKNYETAREGSGNHRGRVGNGRSQC
jgi:hypothetical protein